MVGLVAKLVKLVNGVTKNEQLNGAIRESTGMVDLIGKLAQIGIDSLDGKAK